MNVFFGKKVIHYYLVVLSLVLLAIFLLWHWQLGLHRYFDVDEFAHLHWAYQMFVGQKPYTDFLFFFPPGFHFTLMPLFLFWTGTEPIIAGRILSFVFFVCLVFATVVLFWVIRRSWIALLAGVFLAFLPLPFDKFLEIRPDTVATFCVVIGMIGQILWMRERNGRWGFVSGIFFGLSLVMLPKTLPSVVVASVIALLWVLTSQKKKIFSMVVRDVQSYVLGFIVLFVPFGIWLVSIGNMDIVWYSLTKLPLEANKISTLFFMSPDLFFYPNEVFYGLPGFTQGLMVNHIIWMFGLSVAVFRMCTPFFLRGKDGVYEELLVSAIALVNVILYIGFIPLKHTQYLIPIAVFVAWYGADGVLIIWENMTTRFIGRVVFVVGFSVMSWYLYQTNILVNTPKLLWTNKDSLLSLNNLFTQIPKTELFLDLDGRTLYYPHPYYACCIPFGQFSSFLTRPLPSLSQSLEQTKTKYIYQGELQRTNTLNAQDRSYINTHYIPFRSSQELLIRRDL